MLKRVLRQFKGGSTLDSETVQAILKDENVIISPDTQRENRIPPGQHEDNSWPVLHAGSVAKIDPEKWELKIWGLVDESLNSIIRSSWNYPKHRSSPTSTVSPPGLN